MWQAGAGRGQTGQQTPVYHNFLSYNMLLTKAPLAGLRSVFWHPLCRGGWAQVSVRRVVGRPLGASGGAGVMTG